MALNWTEVPATAEGLTGVTAIEFRVGGMAVTDKLTEVAWVRLPLVPVIVIV